MSIKQIYILQKQIEEKWQEMKDETSFFYNVPFSILKRKEKDNNNRLETDFMFWKNLDDTVLDVNQPKFPLLFFNERSKYKFNGDTRAEEIINDIENLKDLLTKEIASYNERMERSKQISDNSDILRILKEKSDKERFATESISQKEPSKENTVVILILCHGVYVVNDNLTIDKIPFPENKLGEIVKKSVFGHTTLADYDYTSRYIGDKTSTRYSMDVIKRKLKDAYETVLTDTTSLINPEQEEKRKRVKLKMLKDKEAYCKKYGLVKESCMHVGFEFSHVPFLRKLYELDGPTKKVPDIDGFKRSEFAHGIIFMFEDDEGNLIQRNINRLEDIMWLRENGYINIPNVVLNKIEHWGTPDRDLSSIMEVKKEREKDNGSDILITKLDTDFLMRVIETFPEKYNFFKIIDNSCGVFRNLRKKLTDEEEATLHQIYDADMKCRFPLESKGGRRRRKSNNKRKTKKQRKSNKKRKTKKY